MAYHERIYIGKEEMELYQELNRILRPNKKTEIIKMALKSLLERHSENERIVQIRNSLRIDYDSVATYQVERIRSIQSKRITLVKNTYRYIWEQLNHNYVKVNITELLKNIDMQKEICKINSWEYELNQLNELYKIIEGSSNKENFVVLNEIRLYLEK